MARAGRKRKQGVPRKPCGRISQGNERIEPRPEHKARRAALGASDRDQIETDDIIHQCRYLDEDCRQAFQRHRDLRRRYLASIGIIPMAALNLEGARGGRGNAEPTEWDIEVKRQWTEAGHALSQAGAKEKHSVCLLVEFQVPPKNMLERERLILGLRALAMHYGLTTKENRVIVRNMKSRITA